jgi:sulfur carrier protein
MRIISIEEQYRMIIVNGNQVEWEEGLTVKSVLKIMNYTFPKIVVRVNGTVIEQSEWAESRIPDGAEVHAHHLIAGG